MENSENAILNMTKKLIISKHLWSLDEKSMADFKKALCRITPPRGTGHIKKKNLKDKSVEEMVNFIFKCHTEKHAVKTVKTALRKISENQTKLLMENELRDAIKKRKSMVTEQRAFESSVTEEEQGGAQLLNMSSENEVTIRDAVPYFETPTKKIRIEYIDASKLKETTASKNEGYKPVHSPFEPIKKGLITSDAVPYFVPSTNEIKIAQDMDAVPGASKHKETTARKNEGHRPVHSPVKPGIITTDGVLYFVPSTNEIKIAQDMDAVPGASKHKETTARKNEGHRPVHSPLKPEPKSQVNPMQVQITKNIIHTTPNKLFGAAPSHVSYKAPQSPVSRKLDNTTKNLCDITPNKQSAVSPSHTSSNANPKTKREIESP